MFGTKTSSTTIFVLFALLIVLSAILWASPSQAQPVRMEDRVLATIPLEDDAEALRQLESIFVEIGPEHEASTLTRYLRVLRRSRTQASPSREYFEDIEALIASRVHGAAFFVPDAITLEGMDPKRISALRSEAIRHLFPERDVQSWIVPMTVRVLLGKVEGRYEVANWKFLYMANTGRAVLGGSPTANLLMLDEGKFDGAETLAICRRIAASIPVDNVSKCKDALAMGQLVPGQQAEFSRDYASSIERLAQAMKPDLQSLACGNEKAMEMPEMVCIDVLSAILQVCVFGKADGTASDPRGLFVCNSRDIMDVRQVNEEMLSFLTSRK